MSWAYFSDSTPSHPKLVEAGPKAGWLWFSCICYSNAHKLDGRIGRELLTVVAPWLKSPRERDQLVARLVRCRLAVDHKTHVEVHDYASYQRSALKQIVEERETDRDAIRRYERERKRIQRAEKRGEERGLSLAANTTCPGTVPDASGTCPGGTGEGRGGDGILSSLDPREEKSPEVRDPVPAALPVPPVPSTPAAAARTPQTPIGQHRAREPRWRVWQLFEQTTGEMMGDASSHVRALDIIVGVCSKRAGATAGPAFDAAVLDLLKWWLHDPWVAEHRPGLNHLAQNPQKYVPRPAGAAARRKAGSLLAPVSSAQQFAAAAARNPAWLSGDTTPKGAK